MPEATRAELQRLGHKVLVVPPRHSNFGWGQAVLARPDGVHFGASEPRHDGAADPREPARLRRAIETRIMMRRLRGKGCRA